MGRILDAGRVFKAPGGQAYFYTTGTTTLKATFSDAALAVQNANPLTLDAEGRLPAEVFGTGSYTVRVVDTNGALVWTEDDVRGHDAQGLNYNQGGTGAVDQTAEAWMQRTVLHPEDFSTSTIGDGTTDATAAWNAAFVEAASLGGAYVDMAPGAKYKLDGQVTMDGHGIIVRGNGLLNQNSKFIPAYTGGPQFILGNLSTVTYGCGFQHTHFDPTASGPDQYLFQTYGYQRGHWLSCSGQNLYGWAIFGHASSTIASYYYWNNNSQWDMRSTGTIGDGIQVINFLGQYTQTNTAIDANGNTTANTAGFRVDTNVQTRVDGLFINGGGIQRWAYNIHWENARVVNSHIGENCRLDSPLTTSILVRTDAAGGAGTRGFAMLHFHGVTFSTPTQGQVLDCYNNQSTHACNDLQFIGCRSNNLVDAPFVIEGTGGGAIEDVLITNQEFESVRAGTTTTDLIELKGRVDQCIINNILGETTGANDLRDVVRLTGFTGFGLQVDPRSISVEGISGVQTPFQALTDTGATDIINYKTEYTTTQAATSTLADGWYEGQRKMLICVVYAVGDQVVTPLNLGDGATLTFSAVNDWVLLEWLNSNWWIIANNSVAVA